MIFFSLHIKVVLCKTNFASFAKLFAWPPHAKTWLIGKDSAAGRGWGQEEKGTTEDEMAGWHHWLNIRESEWTPGVCDGQRGLACCDSWGRKESDTTERLNWTEWPIWTSLWLSSKESLANEGNSGSIPRSERSPGEGNGNPHQYSCLGNSMDRGTWWSTVHGVTKSQTQLSD